MKSYFLSHNPKSPLIGGSPQLVFIGNNLLGGGFGASVDTDSNGAILETIDYYPFGSTRIDTQTDYWENDYKYTGKELDSDTGLYYYGARYYDAGLGRFISVDPWGGDITDPQSLNKYSYVRNNPLKYVDPEGKTTTEALKGYAIGLGRGAWNITAGTVNAAMHPVDTVTQIAGTTAQGWKEIGDLASNLVTNYDQTTADLKQGAGMMYDEFAQKSDQEMGEIIGEITAFAVGIAITEKAVSTESKVVLQDSKQIRFTQDSISSKFSDGRSVKSLTDNIKAGKTTANDVPPIRVFDQNGYTYTLDNRRLKAFQDADAQIGICSATSQEIKNSTWKFTTKNGGTSVRIRGQNNN